MSIIKNQYMQNVSEFLYLLLVNKYTKAAKPVGFLCGWCLSDPGPRLRLSRAAAAYKTNAQSCPGQPEMGQPGMRQPGKMSSISIMLSFCLWAR